MFQIVSNNGAILKHQLQKEIAGNDARNIMQNNIRIEKAKVTNAWYSGRIDVGEARKTLKDYERNYDRTAPESLDVNTKNAMWKRAKQLKDEFVIGMLSQDELHPVKGVQVDGKINVVVDEEKMRSNRTVERNTAWYLKNQVNLVEYKNIMRHLNPENPGASDIERFRPKSRSV